MKEMIIREIKQRAEDLFNQNKELRSYISDETYQLVYENEIRISECQKIIELIEGGK